MKVIIVGCGRVCQTLAEKLNSDGNAVTVIDKSVDKVNETMEIADVMGVVGNGATHTVLCDAGIESADLFIAVTNSDELNLLCCMIAKKESGCQTIARLKNPNIVTKSSICVANSGSRWLSTPNMRRRKKLPAYFVSPRQSKLNLSPRARWKS